MQGTVSDGCKLKVIVKFIGHICPLLLSGSDIQFLGTTGPEPEPDIRYIPSQRKLLGMCRKVDMESFGLPSEDAQIGINGDWKSEVGATLVLPGKWPLKWYVCVVSFGSACQLDRGYIM